MRSEDAFSSSADLLFAGTVFCDLVFAGVPVPEVGAEVYAEAFLITPGGTANRAVAGARLGASTILLSRLGADPLGDVVLETLRAEPNLDTRFVEKIGSHQTPVTVSMTGAHDRSFITYEEQLPPLELPAGVGAVAATHIGISQPLPEWVVRLRSRGTRIVGGVGWDASGLWPAEVLGRLSDVDVFVPNDVEAMRYTRTDTAHDAAVALGNSVELAVVTRGKDGVVAYNSGTGELTEVPAVVVDAIDPTGAGDVFVASFMTALQHDWSLEDQLRFAGLCASLSVMSLGGAASAPTPAAVSRYLSENQPRGDWSTIRDWSATQTLST